MAEPERRQTTTAILPRYVFYPLFKFKLKGSFKEKLLWCYWLHFNELSLDQLQQFSGHSILLYVITYVFHVENCN